MMLVLATAILVGYCVDRYLQNQNTASIDYKRYHQTKKDIYPSISICFSGLAIYDSNGLEQTYGINNTAEYSIFGYLLFGLLPPLLPLRNRFYVLYHEKF